MHAPDKSTHQAPLVVLAALLALILIGLLAARADARTGAVILDTGALNRPAGIASSGDEIVIGASAEEPGGEGDFLVSAVDQSGRLQPSFQTGNLAGRRIDLGGDEEAEDLTVDRSRRIVQVGCSRRGSQTEIIVVRYAADGQPDPSWGSGGVVRLPAPSSSCATSVAVEPDGGVVVGGSLQRGEDQGGSVGFVARFSADGQLDPSFGYRQLDFAGYDDKIEDLVLQPDGKVVAVGSSTRVGSSAYSGVIVRLLPDGDRDPDFAADGLLELHQDWTALYAVGLRAGEIVASGSTGRGDSQALLVTVSSTGAVVDHQLPLLSRLAGTAAFKRLANRHQLDDHQRNKLLQLLRAGDDSFAATVSGSNAVLAGSRGYAISGIDSAGQFGASFGDPLTPGLGWLLPKRESYLTFANRISDLTVDDQGRILALGDSAFGGLAVARWSPTGRLDHSFGLSSLRLRRARAQLSTVGKGIQLTVPAAVVGARARLTTAVVKHRCRYVNFPAGSSAPDGTYCQWEIVGQRHSKTITLQRSQLLDLGSVDAGRRIVVGVKIPDVDQAYGRILGAHVKALVSQGGVKICNGGRYGCGASG